jgi:hypothetical protein
MVQKRKAETIWRRLAAEGIGTGFLVFFGVGVATLMFGFHFDGGSLAAGVIATSLAFGLVLLGLVYAIGPMTGCHDSGAPGRRRDRGLALLPRLSGPPPHPPAAPRGV